MSAHWSGPTQPVAGRTVLADAGLCLMRQVAFVPLVTFTRAVRGLRVPVIWRLRVDDARTEYRRWRSDHPGNPLGRGYPLGSPLRVDGESHLQAWMRIARADPCAYCGRPYAGTADHVEPRAFPTRGFGGAHCWINLVGACESCNRAKQARNMLRFLTVRAQGRPRRGYT